jgi:hypothetical protein
MFAKLFLTRFQSITQLCHKLPECLTHLTNRNIIEVNTEKAVVFGPMIIIAFVFGLMIIAFLAVVIKLIFRAKNDSYKGKVTNKNYFQTEDTDGNDVDYYSLELECEDGKKRKIAVSSGEYKSAEVGDNYEKIKGSLKPHKI